MRVILSFLILFTTISLNAQTDNETIEKERVEILILGTLHFNQFHKKGDRFRDFTSQERQKEFSEVVASLDQFHPDAVFIEREPKHQKKMDSLFRLKPLDYHSISGGMSEVYQIGVQLAKKRGLQTVYGVDFYESTSQNLMKEGENLEVYQQALQFFQNKGRSITGVFLSGKMTIKEFLIELNKEENIKLSHRLLFNTPAYVRNGSFKNNDDKEIDNEYIGVEFISLFYNRNLKIYANILSTVAKTKAKKVVLIVGQVHVGVLQELLRNNPKFKVVEVNPYLLDKE